MLSSDATMSSPFKFLFSLMLVLFTSAFTNATCTTFSPVSNTTFQPPQDITDGFVYGLPGVNQTFNPYITNTTQIVISDGVTCPANISTEYCYIGDLNANYGPGVKNYTLIPQFIGGLIADNSTLRFASTNNSADLSFPADITKDISDNLFTLIMRASNLTFHRALLDNQTNTFAFAITPGTSGYAMFASRHECVAGIVSGCSGKGYPPDGYLVEACTPLTLDNQTSCNNTASTECLDGTHTWVNTSESQAESISCWPCEYEMLQANATTSAGGVKPTNAASREAGLNVVRTGGVALAVAVAALLV